MEDGAKGSSPATRGSHKLVFALGLLLAIGAGIGIGIGIGAGIWKDNGASANDSTVLATQTCPEGEHNAALNTYFLTTSRVNVSDLPNPYKQEFGRFFEITIPKSSLPPTVPFVKTVMGEGKVYEDVLDSSEFLEMWSKLSATADPDNGTFAMPGLDEAHWCFQQYKAKFDALASGKGLTKSPANAMLSFDTDSRDTLVADIFSVIDAGESYLMHVRLAPTNATMDMNESECHSYQSVNDPHYHHRSRCLAIETDEELISSEDVNGRGMTAFIKITPIVDSAVVAGIAEVASDVAADAGVDAAVDTATDTAADTASDSATDTASDTTSDTSDGDSSDDSSNDDDSSDDSSNDDDSSDDDDSDDSDSGGDGGKLSDFVVDAVADGAKDESKSASGDADLGGDLDKCAAGVVASGIVEGVEASKNGEDAADIAGAATSGAIDGGKTACR